MVTLITYDLKKPGRDYSTLFEAIKSYKCWAHAAESVWLVDAKDTPGSVRDNLQQFIDSNDLLFAIRVNQNWASIKLSEKVVEWLKDSSRNW